MLTAAATDRLAQATQFLSKVVPWPNAGEAAAYVDIMWTFQGANHARPMWTGRAVSSIDEAIIAVQFALKGTDTRDIYVCMSTQREYEEKVSAKGLKYKKAIRNQPNAVALKSLFLDIDCKGEGYANLNDAATALAEFLKATGLPKPSIMVASGGGLHVYWVLAKPLTPDEWRPLAFALAEATKQRGLKCDTQCTIDSARVLRVPNTFNRKFNPPQPVRIAGTPTDFDYSVERLERSLAPYKVAVPGPAPVVPFIENPVLFPPVAAVPDELGIGLDQSKMAPIKLDDVARECAFIRDAIATGGVTYTNPLWNLTTLIATFTEGARADAHRMGNRHPGYTQDSTDELFDRKERDKAQKNLGWPACRTISASGCKSCQACPHLAKGKSPLNFGGLALPQQVTAPVGSKSDQHGRAMHVSALPLVPEKREWLHGTDAMRGAVTLFVAPGARGKSSWLVVFGLACASGRPLLGAHVSGGPLRVLILSAEDPEAEVARRVRAAMQHYKLKDADVSGLYVLGADKWGLPLLRSVGNVPVPAEPGWNALIAEIERIKPDIIVLDPLMSLMGGVDGNNNSAAAILMGKLVELAANRRIAVVIAHHAAKGREPTSQDSAMGAATFVNFARIVLTIEPLSEKDSSRIGVPPWDVKSIFRILGVKQNFSRAEAGDRWFRHLSVELNNARPPVYPNGDKIGVVEPFQPDASGPAYGAAVIAAALQALDTANPPLSPSKRATGRCAADAIVKAIAPHRGGKASDVEGDAVLDHIIRSGLAVVQKVKVPRPGGRADERNGLVVTPEGKAAMQQPAAGGAAASTVPHSPQRSRMHDAGLRDGGSPKRPRNVAGGYGGNAGHGDAAASIVKPTENPPQMAAVEGRNGGTAEPQSRTKNAPADSAGPNELALHVDPAAPCAPKPQDLELTTEPAPQSANDDLTIPNFLRRPLPDPAAADTAPGPDSYADLTIKPR